MNESFANNPLLLLFTVAAIGYFIGKIKIKDASLGVSAVLFVGLIFGSFNVDFNAPTILFELGLVFFVYSIGLSSGPAFFNSFKKNGWRDIGYVMVMLLCTLIVAIATHYIFGFDRSITTGLYTGSTTNTTALAALIDYIGSSSSPESEDIKKAVIGYTYSYPIGVLGVMISLKLMERFFKIDYQAEKEILKKDYPLDANLTTKNIVITNPNLQFQTLRDLVKDKDWNILFGRIKKGNNISLSNSDTQMELGDQIMTIGSKEDLENVAKYLGEVAPDSFYDDRKTYDIRRIFVSNSHVVGKSIASLNLSDKYDAVITRIRRGDADLLATKDTILEMGDRIRFVARRKDLDKLSKFFGDSYYASSTVNLFSFGLGIAMGLVLGLIEFTLPGGINFKLGYAGGPLIVGLVLGALRRTGPIVWTLPYGANVTLQQMGLIILLAVIGLKSGNSFLESLGQTEGLNIFIGGVFLTIISSLISIVIGYKIFKIPYTLLLGFLSNQPAILDFGQNMSKNKIPMIGYTVMFPIAMIIKILYAQVLYVLLS